MAMHAVGQALVQQGRTEEGMALLDEAMAGVIGGEYGDPMTAAQMSCMTMVVCGSCFDLERATQWVQSLQGFIERYGCPFLYAECRTYYGRVLFENGDWGAAEALLVEAISMSQGVFQAPHAFASGTLAELRLAQGRVEDAARVLRGVEGRTEAAAAVASGKTVHPGGPIPSALLADDVAALIDALNLDRPLICGFSDGGETATLAGIRHPGAVRAIVNYGGYDLFNPDPHAPAIAMTRQMLGGSAGATQADPEVSASRSPELRAMFELMKADHDSAQGAGHWKTVIARTFDRVTQPHGYTVENLNAITVPTLILTGDRDPFCTIEDGAAAYRALPAGAFAVLPDTEHLIIPAAVRATIAFFEHRDH
jgi:pimeloyl-ACP methyl ester carboxylesterase